MKQDPFGRSLRLLTFIICAAVLFLLGLSAAAQSSDQNVYLPLVFKPEPTPTPTATSTPTPTPSPSPSPTLKPTTPAPSTEFRGMWVSRFDWTVYNQPASSAKIDEIVNNAAFAGFNVIFFQVRGTADAYYPSTIEPWAQRVSGGQLGQAPNPLWDPLAHFISVAHTRGIQLHAYINVYPVWNCGSTPPTTTPLHFYYLLQQAHGVSGDRLNGLQWDTAGNIHCSVYQRSTPASVYADNHFLAVAQDLVNRYDIDGIHLDNIRYGGSNSSCDPVSTSSYGTGCFGYNGEQAYTDWQRAQVNGTVGKFYDLIVGAESNIWLSAAVWPIYVNYWSWPSSPRQGYYDYYQDSKAWVLNDYIDSISPMIYGSSYWTRDRWQTLVTNFQNDRGGRYIIPGIGADLDFSEIAARIQLARSIGTAGHAIFSYGDLYSHGYFDDLAAGPYAQAAAVPSIAWHP